MDYLLWLPHFHPNKRGRSSNFEGTFHKHKQEEIHLLKNTQEPHSDHVLVRESSINLEPHLSGHKETMLHTRQKPYDLKMKYNCI